MDPFPDTSRNGENPMTPPSLQPPCPEEQPRTGQAKIRNIYGMIMDGRAPGECARAGHAVFGRAGGQSTSHPTGRRFESCRVRFLFREDSFEQGKRALFGERSHSAGVRRRLGVGRVVQRMPGGIARPRLRA